MNVAGSIWAGCAVTVWLAAGCSGGSGGTAAGDTAGDTAGEVTGDVALDPGTGDAGAGEYPPAGVVAVAGGAGDTFNDPRVVAAGDGACLVWTQPSQEDLTNRVFLSRRTGNTWSAAEAVTAEGGYYQEVNVYGTAKPTLTWVSHEEVVATEASLYLVSGDDWSAVEYLEDALLGSSPASPWRNGYFMADGGKLHLVYDDPGDHGLRYITIDGTMSQPLELPGTIGGEDPLDEAHTPETVVTGGSTASVAFVKENSLFYVADVKAGTLDPVQVPTKDAVAYSPRLATNGSAVWLVWGEKPSTDINPSTPHKFYVAEVKGGNVEAAVEMPYEEPNASALLLSLNVTVDAAGRPHTVSLRHENNFGDPAAGIFKVTIEHVVLDGAAWQVLGTLSYANDRSVSLAAPWHALAADGKADVVWVETDAVGNQENLFAARL